MCIYRETEKVGTMEIKLCALSDWGKRERENEKMDFSKVEKNGILIIIIIFLYLLTYFNL